MEQNPSLLRIAGFCSIEIRETIRVFVVIAPPLLVSYSSLKDYLSALPPDIREESFLLQALFERGLPPVVSMRSIAVLFGFSPKLINAMVINNKKYYRYFTIRKGKKSRQIQAPKVALKVIQKWLGHHLAQAVEMNDCVYGFVSGKSAIAAANMHCKAEWVYSIDIKDFFQTTSYSVIKEVFINLGYSEKACNIIVPLCCYGDFLAQGAPSSPVISNLVMQPIDEELIALAVEHNSTFTRYADDIVFSGLGEFPEFIREKTNVIFQNTCWSLSTTKCHLAEISKGQRLKVHGLLVHGEKPRLTKGYRNKIRAYKHLFENNKLDNKDVARIQGHLKYSESVEKYTI